MTNRRNIPERPDENDAEYWGPIVEQRIEEIAELTQFLKDNRARLRMTRPPEIMAAGRKVITQARGYQMMQPLDPDCLRKISEPNAMWAGVFKQALHAMRQEMRLRAPDVAPEMPTSRDPDKGRSR